jgi:hypothetical protein
MAELNFNALIPQGPRGFYQGFEQGQDQRIVRETNQIKLDELKRDRDEMIQLQEKLKGLGQDPDVGKFLDTLAQTGKPDYVKMAIEGKQKIKDLDAYAKLGAIEPVGAAPAMPTGAPAPATPASVVRLPQAPAPTNRLGSGTFGMEPTAPVNAMAPAPAAPVNALAAQPGADLIAPTQQRIRQLLDFARTNPRMAAQAMSEARILQDQLELYSKRGPNEPADVQVMQRLGYPLTQAGYQAFRDAQRQERMLSPAEEEQRIRIANASRAPATPAQPSAPVAVVGEDGKIKYVSREDAINKGMTPASAIESLPPKEIQKREAALPQAKQAVKTVSNTMSVIGQTVDSLLANPEGIDGITGLVYGVTPAITASARKAKAELEQLKNLAFIQGITELRAASKTGAAVGNVTNREGDRFENLKASLDRSQSKDDLIAALKKLKTQADLTTQFMTEAFDDTYSYKSAAPAGGRASGVDANNPLLKK